MNTMYKVDLVTSLLPTQLVNNYHIAGPISVRFLKLTCKHSRSRCPGTQTFPDT